MNKPLTVVAAVALLSGVLLVAKPWRDYQGAPAEPDIATSGFGDASTGARGASELQDSRLPIVEPATTELPVEPARDTVAHQQNLKVLLEGIDPLLRDRNVIAREPDSGQTGFLELESRFRAETADQDWSSGKEAQILAEVAQLTGLKLVSLEAECRATICRLKLFHPPGTNALALDDLAPMGDRTGLGPGLAVATLGADGAPISLLYFQRE